MVPQNMYHVYVPLGKSNIGLKEEKHVTLLHDIFELPWNSNGRLINHEQITPWGRIGLSVTNKDVVLIKSPNIKLQPTLHLGNQVITFPIQAVPVGINLLTAFLTTRFPNKDTPIDQS